MIPECNNSIKQESQIEYLILQLNPILKFEKREGIKSIRGN